jgi:hypothetical protein
MGDIMLCASLVLGALTDFAVGLEDLPDPHRDDFRLIVLGDSFALPTMTRIPTALMARLPEGRIRAWRVPAKPNAAPLRLLDTGPDVFQLNDPSEQGCYGFETDRGGVQIGLPVTRPMDLRVANGASGRAVYTLRLEDLEVGSPALEPFAKEPVTVKVIHRWPTSSLNAVPLTSIEGDWVPGEVLSPGALGELGSCFLERLVIGDLVRLRTANAGSGALQVLDFILLRNSPGVYFSALADESWSYAGYGNNRFCESANDKTFAQSELSNWIAATTLDPSEPIVFMSMLSTEGVLDQDFRVELESIVSQSFGAVEEAGLDVPIFMLFVLPMRHSIGGVLPVEDEPDAFEHSWDAMAELAHEQQRIGAISLYHMTDGIRFDGGSLSKQWLQDRCLNLHRYSGSQYNLALPPYNGKLHDPPMIHPRNEVAATFMARLLRYAWRGWSWPGDVDADGVLTSEDADLVLQAVGQVGDVPEDLNEDGVVDAKDVSEITGRLDCANAPAPPPSPDFNGDGVVGYEDLLILLAFWDQSDPEGYDLNGDGQVDYVDLLVLLSAWTI